jgi:DNA replication initiation complex subunit (GINS family)
MPERIEFSEVSSIYRLERDKHGELAKLPQNFFNRLREHIVELRRQAGVEEAKSPGSKKAMLLIEEVKKLTTMAEHIADCRERKLVLLAQARADLSKKNVSQEEREFVEAVVTVLDTHRATLEGRHLPGEPCHDAQLGERGAEAATLMDGAGHQAVAAASGMALLQVTEDVGEFATAERDYNLRKADVVSLPRAFAAVLIQQGKARELSITS